ncbi:L-fuculose-phosphate aldolase [Parabacteroides sp. PFB2-12]|uniref:class II aldolase/adducin family protein n=1 Tax=unclassified Parabacteroides TaxID=2649774 RepID=UPI0024751F20|nr:MULTISPECIES: class II aldolase/adducin family protein [unclassified Parabacteroides]MDH6341404.1 L-fuculose-phosphate aldolase [Parabacteroides sp. PM6-13]MDH6389198.1 L-fuculose-phosphate aldolase [Parabacteroides sp. PFB2-12]
MKQLDTKLMHPADQITLIIGRIYRSGMTTTSGGNISIKDEQGDIWITPGSIDKGALTAKDIMCVKADGTIVGLHKPSSEFPFHKAIYDMRPDMTAVIHAHPPALVSFSIVHQIPDTNIIPQARGICGKIGFAPYAVPGSQKLGENIAKEFKDNPDYKAVIMENHGVVLCGEDMEDAYQRFETLEFSARTLLNAKILGGANTLTDEQIALHDKALSAEYPHFMNAVYPSDERAIRAEIVKMVRRACDQGLMISSYGTVSVRWRDNDFLITPSGVPRWDMALEDIVQVRDGLVETGKHPSRSIALHDIIYRMNPHINSIILTQSPNLMAFSTSGAKFDVRTIPESWIMLKDVPTAPFGVQYEANKQIAETLKSVPCVLIANDSVVVTGDKLINTFDRLEVAEFTAKSLIMATPLGQLQPISQEEVEALRKAFNVV